MLSVGPQKSRLVEVAFLTGRAGLGLQLEGGMDDLAFLAQHLLDLLEGALVFAQTCILDHDVGG